MPFLCLHICVRDDYIAKSLLNAAIADESTAKKRAREGRIESNLFSRIAFAREVPKQSDHHAVGGLIVKLCSANSGGRLAVLVQEKSWRIPHLMNRWPQRYQYLPAVNEYMA